MRIIYFHGWGGRLDEAKYKILSKFGDEVIYPDIDYKNSKNLINQYSNFIYDKHDSKGRLIPTLVVGNSLGAYMGYHISNIVRCPALLFNPSFYFKNGGEIRPSVGSSSNPDKSKQFILSQKDEEIDIKRTLKFFKELKIEDDNVKIYEDLTHQIPLDVFENEFSEFREKYKDFKWDEEDQQKYPSKGQSKKTSSGRWIDDLAEIQVTARQTRATVTATPEGIAGNIGTDPNPSRSGTSGTSGESGTSGRGVRGIGTTDDGFWD
jgi:uncharacterized protein